MTSGVHYSMVSWCLHTSHIQNIKNAFLTFSHTGTNLNSFIIILLWEADKKIPNQQQEPKSTNNLGSSHFSLIYIIWFWFSIYGKCCKLLLSINRFTYPWSWRHPLSKINFNFASLIRLIICFLITFFFLSFFLFLSLFLLTFWSLLERDSSSSPY